VDASECQGLVGFWVEWGWVGDMRNLTYSKRESVSDFLGEWGGFWFWFRGVYRFVPSIGRVSRSVGWPSENTNLFLVPSRDLKFRVSDKGIKGFIPPDKEPGVVDEFKGEVSLGGGMDSIGSLL
jgi:hypothetical protein